MLELLDGLEPTRLPEWAREPAAADAPFAVAVSFPGEHRGFVLEVVERLAEVLGRHRVFCDAW
ncbi:hypothetical protein [uncultured Thiodictyon sp.]|uniref:hypothetical protein n=1 Tax=uncultured Thiodictyon sp. TaxID=1846217 RepID=UPI0025EFF02B|nr:hypothetical protein [uncultured Thiodictyon sp.]